MKVQEKLLLYKIQVEKNADAYAKLYDQYAERIYRFVFFKISSKEEAEDLTSEIFLKTWNYLIGSKERHIKSFSGLIYRIARNSLVDFYREKSRKQEQSLEDAQDVGEDDKNYKMIEVREEVKPVLEAIKKMKESYQEIILLHYIEELSSSEIAEVLGKSRTNVRVTLHRAMKLLKQFLEEK